MPGVVFLICIPSASYEREISANEDVLEAGQTGLRLEVELRDKHAVGLPTKRNRRKPPEPNNIPPNVVIPMEKVLKELLKKLEIDHAVWTIDQDNQFHQVLFPLESGDPCETTLHCLTELGIGTRLQSNVSVLPCSVSYDAAANDPGDESTDFEAQSKWNSFVDSIRSKLTVKQVVDSVRAGGSFSFDYILLIVTADSLAALGLVENNAPNIVAAMLVSPLMGPVMSITFGAIIADRELVKAGFIALSVGMFTSVLFGFIFGLILGTTEMPWGFGDWPTEEMKGRGNARSLWMGVLWALTSGTGVAVALLQGGVGPLIGVAISASLLPPLVNCGLFWALACIWLIYDGTKIPHLKGEQYSGNSSYPFVYTDYIPTEFLINGIVSGLLTVVNVICIFITAIIVLKIKEVASPYTSSPDLRRFWETDIRTVRRSNQSTIRRLEDNKTLATMLQNKGTDNLNTVFEQAVLQATDNDTFRKVKRMSYSSNAAEEGAVERIKRAGGTQSPDLRASKLILPNSSKALEQLASSLIQSAAPSHGTSSPKLTRFGSFTRSLKGSLKRQNNNPEIAETSFQEGTNNGQMPTILERNQSVEDPHPPPPSIANGVRNVLSSLANAPHRLSQSLGHLANSKSTARDDEENANLTNNIQP